MRFLGAPVALAVMLLLSSCTSAPAPAQTPSPREATSEPAGASPSPTPSRAADPEPGPLAAIEVTAAGLTFLDDAGVLIDDLELDEGSAAFEETLGDLFGDPSSVAEDNQCHTPGTIVTRWAEAGVTLTVAPPSEGDADPFLVHFGVPDFPSAPAVRIPDGPALTEDASAYFAALPADQRHGVGYGTMVYDLAPDSDPEAPWGHHGAAGYVDHDSVLRILTTPGTHSSFFC